MLKVINWLILISLTVFIAWAFFAAFMIVGVTYGFFASALLILWLFISLICCIVVDGLW